MLKLLVILFIFLLFDFGTQSPMGFNVIDEQGSATIPIWIWEKGKELIEKQPLEVLYKESYS